MSIREKLERLVLRMHDAPQYNSQGAVLFVDLEQRKTLKKYLPLEVLKNFLGGRGANMWLLYNLVEEEREALDPEIPLIFGSGVLTSSMPSAVVHRAALALGFFGALILASAVTISDSWRSSV